MIDNASISGFLVFVLKCMLYPFIILMQLGYLMFIIQLVFFMLLVIFYVKVLKRFVL